MNVLAARVPSWAQYPDSRDVVDNKPNESLISKTSQNSGINHLSAQMSTSLEQMRFEEQRLKTFQCDWPHSSIRPRVLAKTGFYYIGPVDQVRCYFCGVKVSRWEQGDDEVGEHSRWSPSCMLLKRADTTNVPLEPVFELDRLLPPPTYDVCGIDVRPGSYPETQSTSSTSTVTENTPSLLNNLNHPMLQIERDTQTLKHPDFPKYAIKSVRLRSYDEWPRAFRQRPQQLCDAGFFYTQKSDRVICFSCGGVLRDWEDDDDPWEQHALFFDKCDYLHLVKGAEFVDAVKVKFTQSNSETNNGGSLSSTQESVASSCGSSSSGNSATTNNELSDDSQSPNSNMCIICCTNEYNTIFLPCRHLIACAECASSVTQCPMCRKPFERVMKVFLPN